MHLSIVTTSTLIKIFSIEKKKIIYMIFITGGVAEWLNAPVLKTDVGESLPWVRIPPPPPIIYFLLTYTNIVTLRVKLLFTLVALCWSF